MCWCKPIRSSSYCTELARGWYHITDPAPTTMTNYSQAFSSPSPYRLRTAVTKSSLSNNCQFAEFTHFDGHMYWVCGHMYAHTFNIQIGTGQFPSCWPQLMGIDEEQQDSIITSTIGAGSVSRNWPLNFIIPSVMTLLERRVVFWIFYIRWLYTVMELV